MSRLIIDKYLNNLSDLKRFSGRTKETVVREAFKDLLKDYARVHDLRFLAEYDLDRQDGKPRTIDGALVYDVRLPFGYWEAKDGDDDLDREIENKFRRGYPRDNIIFEDSQTAVLFQNGQEVMRCPVTDVDRLAHLLELFFGFVRPEIGEFRKAITQFQLDLPNVLAALREMIEAAQAKNAAFKKAAERFLKHAKETINPSVTAEDIREMLIQHILTEEIFSKVFDEDDFHRHNNVAKELYALEGLFFKGELKKNTLRGLEPYYNSIRATAHQIKSHNEKQNFLKVIYEKFYKVYNPKAADRLGVVYTPQEIVRFMIESADWLCQKHFGKSLIDRNVEILDPATGTGTFICEVLEHFRGQKTKLAHKYKEELHANEVAILPYYVANLNIEATYAAIMGQYAEFPNLCFVDTLDNVAGLGIRSGYQHDLFGALSEENVERIKRQNKRKISVVIGNPPYNANQQNENDNNKNRAYPKIDQRIKDTYIRKSTAQKTKAYDMYTRFFRWASDRLHDDGILAFVTNRSFIESRTMDGFRKAVAGEYSDIYVVDLGGDVRANPKLSGTKHNVFGIQTGVAISFLIKRASKKDEKRSALVHYARRPEMETAEDKLASISQTTLEHLELDVLSPDEKGNWIVGEENDFSDLMPLASKETKNAKSPSSERAIFKLYSLGVVTARDEWVYSPSKDELRKKLNFFINVYDEARHSQRLGSKYMENNASILSSEIKWTRSLKKNVINFVEITFNASNLNTGLYRPFVDRFLLFDKNLNEMQYQLNRIFSPSHDVETILLSGFPASKKFQTLATNKIPSYDTLEKTECLPRFYIGSNKERVDNITNWALNKFIAHYGKNAGGRGKTAREITKDAIFHYVYAVLHDPIYRETYAQNLKRDFPRIPLYPDFWRWADWGERLMSLHIGFETVKPWPLQRVDAPDKKSRAAELAPKTILRSDHEHGIIVLDSETQLSGVPAAAWSYRLGNRTALDWILDQHKEKTPKDPTIRAKFNTYRFADHKEKVVDLLMRVTRVSVETSEIVEAMKVAPRGKGGA